ncbi:MAG: GGDEF domain-containing protein [Burkholderiales bacterium]|nr:GGDEF domain-containing protein [Burkholderiales bacterium]MDE2456633.1 GGDEF domain-containing protein [Burkholderiales bacterium]
MSPASLSALAQRSWTEYLAGVEPHIRERVAATVERLAPDLAEAFYSEMLTDADASKFLDHAIVDARLHAAMVRWLRGLFSPKMTLAECLAEQTRAGEMHARVGVPVELVAAGARVLKRGIAAALVHEDLARDDLPAAFLYVHELFDLALGAMTTAFNASSSRLTRADEAYRLFFLGQDMKAERERQKSQLLEWAQDILVTHYWNAAELGAGEVPKWTGGSQFELWLQHKASLLFEGASEVGRIQELVSHIEDELLPGLSGARESKASARAIVAAINARVEEIKALLGSMFDRYIEVEDGRDGVTRLLNRRFFPSVARREIGFAMSRNSLFALLLVEIDGFESLGATLGSEGADAVLAQIADVLTDSVRAGDFVFRFGDGQFLVLLVEVSETSALPVAEGLRKRIETTSMRTLHLGSTLVTASVGVALFDGHPDYQRLLDRANDALQQARAIGPNRCAVAADKTGLLTG